MSSVLRESPISRCPPEIWLRIFRLAMHVPFEQECEDPKNAIGLDQNDFACGYDEWVYSLRSTARATGMSLLLVCKSWRAFVEPLLYELLLITMRGWSILKDPTPLRRSIEGHTIGSLIRLLHIDINDDYGIISNQAFLDDVQALLAEESDDNDSITSVLSFFTPIRTAKLLTLCPNLEIFIWTIGGNIVAPPLDCLPTNKLRTLTVTYRGTFQLADLSKFICSCPRLAVLDVRRCTVLAEDTWSNIPHRDASVLETLALYLTESNSQFFSFLSSLDLPRLRRLSLIKDDEANLTIAPLAPLLDRHGKHLISVALNGLKDIEATYMNTISELLFACPSLEDFAFEAPDAEAVPVDLAHESLQRVGLDGFFRAGFLLSARILDLERHADTLRTLMQRLCSPEFPKLSVVRLLDVVPGAATSPSHQTFEESYVWLCQDLLRISQERGIRLEDSLGQELSVERGFASLYPPIRHYNSRAGADPEIDFYSPLANGMDVEEWEASDFAF